MPGPEQDLTGEIVLVEIDPAPGQPAKGPRIFRYDGDPNDPGFVREPSTLVLDRVNNVVWKSNGDGTWANLSAAEIGFAVPNVVSAQPSGLVILDIPSGNTTIDFPVLEKIEVLDLWLIKTVATGTGSDGIVVFHEIPPAEPAMFAGPFQVDLNPGGIIRSTQLAADRVLNVGDNLRVSRGFPLVTNNAVQIVMSVIRLT